MSKPPIRDALHRLEAAFSPDASNEHVETAEAPGPALDPALRAEAVRIAEALLFAGGEPMTATALAAHLPAGADVADVLATLRRAYAGRGVQLVEAGGAWRFQSAGDLSSHFSETRAQPRRLPKAAMETLAVIAYHQPVTRAEIEEIRGVSLSRGSLDLLLELDWVKPRGRRRSPGRPLTFGTTETFLSHFGLASLDALPGKADLSAAGYIDPRIDPAFEPPRPDAALAADEDPLEDTFGGKVDDAAFYVDYADGDDEGA
jgi:segregation and condensation protein B